jgi:phytoene synthase
LPLTREESYRHCERIARAQAKNFYYSFLVLPRRKRLAMCAIYAFMRECDDLSDEAGASHANLDAWREDMHLVLAGEARPHPVWPAFADTVQSYGIPFVYFDDMIDGVRGDVDFVQPRNFEELYRYCYRVASVVGLTITHIFGFRQALALEMAEKCGIAFQLTNILRDVKEDIGKRRIYLPADAMREHRVGADDLSAAETSPALRALLASYGARAREYYDFSRSLIPMVDRDSQGSLWALIEIYERLFQRIDASGFRVLEKRHSLPGWEKAAVLARALFR